MNKLTAPFAVVTGMVGLAMMTRSDILYSTPIGISLIFICGILLFVTIKSREDSANLTRADMLEAMSLGDIKLSLATIADMLNTIAESENTHSKQIVEKLSENHIVSLRANDLLEQIKATVQAELKSAVEDQAKSSRINLETILKAIDGFETHKEESDREIIKLLKKFDEAVHESNCKLVERVNELHSMSSQANESLGLILTTLKDETQTVIKQQQQLYEIILEDIKETLTEFNETQLRNAEDNSDIIKRIMNETNKALKDLPLSLETFSTQNAKTMQKSAEGFERFEVLINATLDQLTSISTQDYELLKGMLK